ncbi:MAG: LD-carboxypeptidase [Kofleriaceae bacterium]
MRPIAPPRLRRGQTIGIAAPSGPVNQDRLRQGLARLGTEFGIKLAPSVTAPAGTPRYLSAPDEVRAAELNAMLGDPDVRAIILARGGYGLTRILPRLDAELVRRDPKPIVGFSDATALLSWAWAAGVRGIHGPLIVQLGDLPDDDVAHLVALLTEPRPAGVRPWELQVHGRGVYRGPVIAGNLTLVSMLVGTPWQVPLEGAIALLEEIGEKPYELDRYLTQLALTGELAKPIAAVVGDLTRCMDPLPMVGEPDITEVAFATVLERLRATGTPSAVGAPVGHGARNEAIPFGAISVLDLDRKTFEITEAAVS